MWVLLLHRRLYIFPLGFHEDFILRRLTRTNATKEDYILVITCQPVGAGTRIAYESLRARTIDLGYGEPFLLPLECNEPATAMKTLWEAIEEKTCSEIIIDISGGMRILSAITILTLLLKNKAFTIYYQPESGTFEETHIPREITQLIINPLTKIEKQTLEIIKNKNQTTINEIAKTMNKKEKTIANIITRLKNRKLIIKRTRKQTIQPTKWAQII